MKPSSIVSRNRNLATLNVGQRKSAPGRPVAAHRGRSAARHTNHEPFAAPETWHEPTDASPKPRFVVEPPGQGYVHPVTKDEVNERIERLPTVFTHELEVIQFSRMTRKRHRFPCYGMHWGWSIYLYPIEETLVEMYTRAPLPAQRIEAEMYGALWIHDKEGHWRLEWTRAAIKDYYLNNILIHEIGHLVDNRNSNRDDRERYAEWFAIEYGYRATGGRGARSK
jgi:hypothetical protein